MADLNTIVGPGQHELPFLDFLENGRNVRRFHTHHTTEIQTVGAHSFGVAWLCWYLCAGEPSVRLLMAGLSHDMGEFVTGDVPSPVKKRNLTVKLALDNMEEEVFKHYEIHKPLDHESLTNEERLTLKRADILDGMLFCLSERRVGNKKLHHVFVNFCNYYLALPEHTIGRAVYTSIRNAYALAFA